MDELELDDVGDCSAGRTPPCPASASRAAQVHSGTHPPPVTQRGPEGTAEDKKRVKKGPPKKNSRAGVGCGATGPRRAGPRPPLVPPWAGFSKPRGAQASPHSTIARKRNLPLRRPALPNKLCSNLKFDFASRAGKALAARGAGGGAPRRSAADLRGGGDGSVSHTAQRARARRSWRAAPPSAAPSVEVQHRLVARGQRPVCSSPPRGAPRAPRRGSRTGLLRTRRPAPPSPRARGRGPEPAARTGPEPARTSWRRCLPGSRGT